MSEIVIFKLTSDKFDSQIREFWVKTNLEMKVSDLVTESALQCDLENPFKYHESRNGAFFVAIDSSKKLVGIVGLLNLAEFNIFNGFQIQRLTVSPEYQKQGVGKKLMEACRAFAAEKNIRTSCLGSDENAVRLYDSIEWLKWSGTKTFSRDGKTLILRLYHSK